jgi:transcriptional regulator with XRE-family HTH domain
MPFKQIPDLEIPADVAIPTCDHCGAEMMGKKDLAALDAAMARAYASALASKAEEAIRVLGETANQRDLERLLGLSAGYLSKLKNGKAEPSASTTALLMLLADHPALVDSLRRRWSMTVPIPAMEQAGSWAAVFEHVNPATGWSLPPRQTRSQLESWVELRRTGSTCASVLLDLASWRASCPTRTRQGQNAYPAIRELIENTETIPLELAP